MYGYPWCPVYRVSGLPCYYCNPIPPKKVYGRATDLAIMYLQSREFFWGRANCALMFAKPPTSIYQGCYRTKTRSPVQSVAYTNPQVGRSVPVHKFHQEAKLLGFSYVGPYLREFHDFRPFFGKFLQKKALGVPCCS